MADATSPSGVDRRGRSSQPLPRLRRPAGGVAALAFTPRSASALLRLRFAAAGWQHSCQISAPSTPPMTANRQVRVLPARASAPIASAVIAQRMRLMPAALRSGRNGSGLPMSVRAPDARNHHRRRHRDQQAGICATNASPPPALFASSRRPCAATGRASPCRSPAADDVDEQDQQARHRVAAHELAGAVLEPKVGGLATSAGGASTRRSGGVESASIMPSACRASRQVKRARRPRRCARHPGDDDGDELITTRIANTIRPTAKLPPIGLGRTARSPARYGASPVWPSHQHHARGGAR